MFNFYKEISTDTELHRVKEIIFLNRENETTRNNQKFTHISEN